MVSVGLSTKKTEHGNEFQPVEFPRLPLIVLPPPFPPVHRDMICPPPPSFSVFLQDTQGTKQAISKASKQYWQQGADNSRLTRTAARPVVETQSKNKKNSSIYPTQASTCDFHESGWDALVKATDEALHHSTEHADNDSRGWPPHFPPCSIVTDKVTRGDVQLTLELLRSPGKDIHESPNVRCRPIHFLFVVTSDNEAEVCTLDELAASDRKNSQTKLRRSSK